ncbi:MAG: flippase-like domain-containing protein [Bacteroidaceae bacterium]|nr:flippase-like domain-containing protein [Bacteroidaceae bacterium]
MKKVIKNVSKWLLPLLIAAGILYYMYHDFDFHEVWTLLTEETKMVWLFVSLIFILLSHYLRGIRWLLTLEPIGYRPRTINSVLSIYIAYASNILVPRVGEISRCGVLAKYDGIPFSKSLGTLVAERIVDFILAFAIFAVMMIWQFDKLYTIFDKTGTGESGISLLLKNPWFYVIVAIFIALFFFVRHLFKRSKKPAVTGVKKTIDNFVEGFISLKNIKRPGLFILYTLLIWLCYYLEFYICFYSFPFMAELGPLTAAVVFSAINVAIIIPTPNGAGPWHFVVITLLGLYGIAEPQAASFALIVHTFQTIFVLIFGATAWILLQLINRKYHEN